ncbi:unnamed protein product [Anisakis simplex]|uniref:guanylate cyclase n=1 Tax=Anisakis simplex TaxID=6269 RepID=A0A0M3JIW5_ANISI|nr:unnamed protein product [Anisakis simplex]
MDEKFHGAFIRDIIQIPSILKGLEYLHASAIGYHGSLTPWACLIDRNWMLKLTDFGIAESIEIWEKLQIISGETVEDDDKCSGAKQKTSEVFRQFLTENTTFFAFASLEDD